MCYGKSYISIKYLTKITLRANTAFIISVLGRNVLIISTQRTNYKNYQFRKDKQIKVTLFTFDSMLHVFIPMFLTYNRH